MQSVNNDTHINCAECGILDYFCNFTSSLSYNESKANVLPCVAERFGLVILITHDE